MVGRGDIGQLGPRHGQQCLVPRYHGFSRSKGGRDQLVGRVNAANELDHHIDIGADHQGRRVAPDEIGWDER